MSIKKLLLIIAAFGLCANLPLICMHSQDTIMNLAKNKDPFAQESENEGLAKSLSQPKYTDNSSDESNQSSDEEGTNSDDESSTESSESGINTEDGLVQFLVQQHYFMDSLVQFINQLPENINCDECVHLLKNKYDQIKFQASVLGVSNEYNESAGDNKISELGGLEKLAIFVQVIQGKNGASSSSSSSSSTSPQDLGVDIFSHDLLDTLSDAIQWYADNYSNITAKFKELIPKCTKGREEQTKTSGRRGHVTKQAPQQSPLVDLICDDLFEGKNDGIKKYFHQLDEGSAESSCSFYEQCLEKIALIKEILAVNDTHVLVANSTREVSYKYSAKKIIKLGMEHIKGIEYSGNGKIGGGHIFLRNGQNFVLFEQPTDQEVVQLHNAHEIVRENLSFCAGKLQAKVSKKEKGQEEAIFVDASKYTSGFLLQNKDSLPQVLNIILQAATACCPCEGIKITPKNSKLIGLTEEKDKVLRTFVWSCGTMKFIVHFIEQQSFKKTILDTFFPLVSSGSFNFGATDLPFVQNGDFDDSPVLGCDDAVKIVEKSLLGLNNRIGVADPVTLGQHGFSYPFVQQTVAQNQGCLTDSLVPLVDFDERHIAWSFIDNDTHFYWIKYFFEGKNSLFEKNLRSLIQHDSPAQRDLFCRGLEAYQAARIQGALKNL